MLFGLNVTFQPLGPEPDSSMSSAEAVPTLVTTIGTVVSLPADARVEISPSRPLSNSFGWPVMSRPSSAVAEVSSAATRATTLYLPGPAVFGGVTLSLTSLAWPASIGTALSSWLPYCSVKDTSKLRGARSEEHTSELQL